MLRDQFDCRDLFRHSCLIPKVKVTDWGNTRRYMENEKELHNKLVARGRRYFELNNGASLQDYYGDRFPRVYKDVSTFMHRRETRNG